MGQALYRKYRSKSFDEVVGQEHITTTLKNALKKGLISHAYLFTGPRGVGKTSIARLLAYAVNSLKYDENNTHLDIIEIDAASNRRIDEVRDLRDKVHIAPTSGKYKIYIIDEVHMLTKEAFNALLKTLEEPPAHVIFILATTEAYKLPETIISRTQRFSFKPISPPDMVKHLSSISKKEDIKIEPFALQLIAEHADGSVRDGISMLDQARSSGNAITKAAIETYLGLAPKDSIKLILAQLSSSDANGLLETLAKLRSQGIQASQLARQIGQAIREDIINSNALPSQQLMSLLRNLIDVPASHNPERLLEIILLEQQSLSREPASQAAPVAKSSQTAPEEPAKAISDVKAVAGGNNSTGSANLSLDQWPNVLKVIKEQNNTLYGVLRMAVPELSGNILTLRFRFPFHQKRISESKNATVVIETVKSLTGEIVSLQCLVDNSVVTDDASLSPEPQPNAESPMDNISNIFGSAEVLDS